MKEASYFQKAAMLATLALTGSAYVVLLRYSKVVDNLRYISSTVVAVQEVLKMLVTICVLFVECGGFKPTMSMLKLQVLDKAKGTFSMALPSCLYALQNNMIFVSLANMDVPIQQVLFQLKIPFTAFLCVLLLGKSLTTRQWFAVFMIFTGTGAIEYQSAYGFLKNGAAKAEQKTSEHEDNFVVGFVAVLVASLCSALAGVYFEKMIKQEDSPIWVRNFQMYIWSIPATLLSSFLQDFSKIKKEGFFVDYTSIVWLIIIVSSLGGILVSFVLLHTDNVTKSFAASTSLVLSTFASYLLFEYNIGIYFAGGMILVCCAIYVYAHPLPSNKHRLVSTSDEV
ncbi:CMP-sialic acid transporter-like isoform X1 [Clavelina lepadiformis]|uniref:UDP-N-acetylglucosamine transporter n=1 Tax=Clavelina lepadiformis TaxID=159417 RepID=A0ABP0GMM5_CLALP